MKRLLTIAITILMTAGFCAGEVFAAACYQPNPEYTQCQEIPDGAPMDEVKKVCEKCGGKIVDKCPLPETGYCQGGNAEEGILFTWGTLIDHESCGHVWHGPGASSTTTDQPEPSTQPTPPAPPVTHGGAGGIQEGQVAADKIRSIVPPRPGDTVIKAFHTSHVVAAKVASNASMADVMKYYENALASKGWKTGSKFIQGEEGVLIMVKGDIQFVVAAAPKDKLKGNAKTMYGIQVTGPGI